jgi:hypothetical protein
MHVASRNLGHLAASGGYEYETADRDADRSLGRPLATAAPAPEGMGPGCHRERHPAPSIPA